MNHQNRAVLAITLLGMLVSVSLRAQVMMPMELPDPKAQHLQQRHLQTLMAIARELESQRFNYPFYFSSVLDVDINQARLADQRSIRFDTYQGRTVLEITGNYYASYSADRMDAYARLKETFTRVVDPILRTEAPHFPDDSEFSAFAIEVSHHVRQKVMGIASERPENVTVIIPVAVAQRFVDAKNDDARQDAILQAEVFLNGDPYTLWLRDGAPTEEWKASNPPPQLIPAKAGAKADPLAASAKSDTVASNLLKPVSIRIVTPETLAGLQRRNQDAIDRMVTALDPEAHFLPYAAPSFVGFRQGAYLQLSFRITIDAPASSSRYKLAALAFDDKVAHLIRPLLQYFPPDVDFDGVDFSATVAGADSAHAEAVEFFVPYRGMRCFAGYDCSGQQLLDAGTVVINGERATLDLQIAEGKN